MDHERVLGGLRWVLLAVVGVASNACGSGGDDMAQSCVTGTERCPCYANKSCNEGLVCLSDVCVAAQGTGGTSSTTPSNGGTTTSGIGGSPASGGSTASPSGGSTASPSGGSTNTGGGSTTASGGTTAAGPNLILDPEFNNVEAYWSAIANGGDAATLSCSGGQCCVTNEYSTYFAFSLGYPLSSLQAFAVEGGATYTLTFRARGSIVNSLEVKVGQAVSPYGAIYSSLATVSSTLSDYSRQFTPAVSEAQAGLVFNAELGSYGSICFALVSLTKN